ncbi:thiamine-phosphate diphosphorylase [Chitinophaga sp. CF118]|uniref:thiamine phosphate synthase n=1 Tax=Chitinophaga sp. CF118 TaxID=1884367 RepID=UPI0008E8A8D1|nr:thiamine phosphate synthase [Chitinophaga sp. CF118]SFD32721.1 thiamine-phosphate diphosphorylase [Chitinophaga sp. CF118]
MISKLQYISQHNHIDNIQAACEAGCRWIQLRIKDAPESIIMSEALAAKAICATYGAKLIINDHPHIAKAIGADGVHVGKKDMTVAAARKIVGNDIIVGGTANTLSDILQHVQDGASYVGLGPYRFTTTKQKLSPILGLEGIGSIMQQLKTQGIDIPIIAIGGILEDDLPELMSTGIHGIAVSGLITQAANKQQLVFSITNYFESCNLLS